MWGDGSVLKAVTAQARGPKFVCLVPSRAHTKLRVVAHACNPRAGEMEARVPLGFASQWVPCSVRDPVSKIREWERERVEENSSCWLLISTHMCTNLCGHPLTHTGLHTGTHSQTNTYAIYIYIYSLIDRYQEEIVVTCSASGLAWWNTPTLHVSSFGPRQSANKIPESFTHPLLILSQCSGLKNQDTESSSSSVLELDA